MTNESTCDGSFVGFFFSPFILSALKAKAPVYSVYFPQRMLEVSKAIHMVVEVTVPRGTLWPGGPRVQLGHPRSQW